MPMKTACEVMVLEYMPVLRAMMAKRMMEKYGLTQKETAKLLGISQPAVSQYKKQIRGRKAEILSSNPEASVFVETLARRLASGEINGSQASSEFCDLCRQLKPNGTGGGD
ncbi:MAG: helix-turn-helix domain-containing protein [Candidatus Aenigmarchaeota archaeon]|nr:helix-turn-helix domain-containing protein [Candidatus Aenigmarchaeota archaeon]